MSIFERAKKVIVEVLAVNEAEVLRESSFENDLGADSLDYVALLQALEEEFNIRIPDEDAPKIKTVEEATKYIESKI